METINISQEIAAIKITAFTKPQFSPPPQLTKPPFAEGKTVETGIIFYVLGSSEKRNWIS
jgi:hypothetical protein